MKEVETTSYEKLPIDVERIVSEVEQLTGKSYLLVPDPRIEMYANATVEPASGEQAHHILRYAPGHEQDLAHLIAHESGHLLRLYGAPEEQRRIPYISREHRERANSEMKSHRERLERRVLPSAVLNELEGVWHQGLVRQLYNTPTDMRIERWIRENYYTLQTAQRRSLKVNLAENQQVLRPAVAAFTPGKLTRIANVLNAAYAIYLGWLLEDKRLEQPYRKTPYYKDGLELAKQVWNSSDQGHDGDNMVVQDWAQYFGVENWFDWALVGEADYQIRH